MESETLSPPLASPAAPTERAGLRPLSAVAIAAALAAALAVAWVIVAPRSPDLAAQAYRSYLFDHFGVLVWDNNWYGGHHMPGYSLLYQPLASLMGLRAPGALAVIASSAIFAAIGTSVFGPNTRIAAAAFAIAAAGDLWIGRLTFALGVMFALAAVLALVRGRGRGALVLAALCAALSGASSPVAGLLLCLAAVTEMIASRRLRYGLALIVPVLLVVAPLQLLFPEGGFEPYGLESFLPSMAVGLAFIWALPPQERTLRIGGLIFVAANVVSLLPTPMGSNIVRYVVLLAGPLLLCALARGGGLSRGSRLPAPALAAVLLGIAFWVAWGPITQSSEVLSDPSTTAAYYQPVRNFLAVHVHGPVRIEVPFTRSHWETALLAPHVLLARGWERQLDKRYDEAIEADPLSSNIYENWLYANAVSYVALPDVPLDGSSVGEAALVRRGTSFLREVSRSNHWRIYEVRGGRPLLAGPGKLLTLGHQGFSLRARSAGSFLVRVHYTPYWSVVAGSASVRQAGEWTRVMAKRPGLVRVQATFSAAGAVDAIGLAVSTLF